MTKKTLTVISSAARNLSHCLQLAGTSSET
jgi:hypothetical protein